MAEESQQRIPCLVDGTGSRKSLAAPSATASKGKWKTPEEEYREAVERPDANKRTKLLAPNGKTVPYFTFGGERYLAKITSKKYPGRSSQNFYNVESVSVEKIAARGIHEAIAKGQPLDTSGEIRISNIIESVNGVSKIVDEGDDGIYARRFNVGDGNMVARIVLREDVNGNIFYDEELTSLENIKEIENPVTRKPITSGEEQSPYAPHSVAKFFAEVNRASAYFLRCLRRLCVLG